MVRKLSKPDYWYLTDGVKKSRRFRRKMGKLCGGDMNKLLRLLGLK